VLSGRSSTWLACQNLTISTVPTLKVRLQALEPLQRSRPSRRTLLRLVRGSTVSRARPALAILESARTPRGLRDCDEAPALVGGPPIDHPTHCSRTDPVSDSPSAPRRHRAPCRRRASRDWGGRARASARSVSGLRASVARR
jgi:hypothetical protein